MFHTGATHNVLFPGDIFILECALHFTTLLRFTIGCELLTVLSCEQDVCKYTER